MPVGIDNCWTVNATPLAEEALARRLERAGQQHGHRLRILTGAMAGLDGEAAATVDDQAEVSDSTDFAPSQDPGECVFSGSAAAAAEHYPERVNVGATAARDFSQSQVPAIRMARSCGNPLSS